MDGMANRSELSINVVIANRPKMLLGRSQNTATQRVRRFVDPSSWVREYFLHAVGEQREPKPILSLQRNVVSPYRPSKEES